MLTPRRVLFLGLGGAGQRHLRKIHQKLPGAELYGVRSSKVAPLLNSDFTINPSLSMSECYGIKILNEREEAREICPDLVVISSPTSIHDSDIRFGFELGANIMVEKPAFLDPMIFETIEKKIVNESTRFFVSFQRQFHPLVMKFREILKSGQLGKLEIINVEVSSFVPDWHPYEDFRELYACRKDLGGGVLNTECHELYFILDIFGPPTRHKYSGVRDENYALDVDTSSNLCLFYSDFTVNFSLSILRQPPRRKIRAIGSRGSLVLDLICSSLQFTDEEGGGFEINDNTQPDKLFDIQIENFLKRDIDSDFYQAKVCKYLAELLRSVDA